jgi:hypothetical protein
VSRLPEAFDPSRPTNSVEAAAAFAGVSRGLAYAAARSGEWPALRVGARLLVKTVPFMALLGCQEAAPSSCRCTTEHD